MSDSAVARRGPVERGESVLARILGWWSNPWGRPRFLAAFVWIYVAWSLLPVLIAVQFGFNDGRSRTAWQGFSTRWFTGDPDLSVLHDPTLRDALFQSLRLASLTMLIATPLGVALAIGLARWRGRGARHSNMLMLFPLVTPEIVMGVALFLVFTELFDFVGLGTRAQTLGHVTFTLSYVVIVVRARLLGVGREYEEAAMDLGASHWQAIRYVLFPILRPAILASLMIAFAISIDDFVISAFLQSTQKTAPIPVLIYSAARSAPTPALNALATVLLAASLISITAAIWILRHFRRREGGSGTSIEDFAHLDLGTGRR